MQTADRVRQILSTRGLTLYQVSQRSAAIFGHSSPYYIPQDLYHELSVGGFSPNIHQLLAFTRITNYRLCDWLAIFGFCLDDIPRLQLLIPWQRTVLLDSSIYDEEQWIPWFVERFPEARVPAITPMRQVLKVNASRRARELLALNKRRFIYAKVGRGDLFAFPDLALGSIARIDAGRTGHLMSTIGSTPSKNIFLVENGLLLNCGRLRRVDNQLFLCSTRFPFTQTELTLGRRARILGVVDAEIRPFTAQRVRDSTVRTPTLPKGSIVLTGDFPVDLQQLLRISRMRVGISFREASAMSQWIAHTLTDQLYFASPSTLSDYENVSPPIRHIQKIISLCILYCIDFWTFLRAGGLQADFLGHDPLPDEMIARRGSPREKPFNETVELRHLVERYEGFLSTLIDQWEELPIFVASALPAISGLKNISLSDIFWVGGNDNPIHPCLLGASLVAVNRRVKIPTQLAAPTVWEQPLYVLLLRDGSYLCGSCVLRQGVLTVHPHFEKPHSSLRLRNGIDAEVTGRITAILRRLF
jgi:hypothetical protein